MMVEPRYIEHAADVDDQVLGIAEDVMDAYFPDGSIEWEVFIDRLAERGVYSDPPFDFDFWISPAVSKIQRHIRRLRREMRDVNDADDRTRDH